MSGRLAILVGIFCAVAISAAPAYLNTYQYTFANPANGWTAPLSISYDFNSTHAWIGLSATLGNPGWLGFAVNPIPSPGYFMIGDLAMFTWNGTAGQLCDMLIINTGQTPVKDTQQDLTLIQIAYEGGVLVGEYVRRLSTNDTQDRPLVPNSGTYAFAAYNGGPVSSCTAIPQHQGVNYGGSVDAFKFGGCPGTPACNANGVCNAGTCTCNGYWTGSDCSQAAFCLNRADCSNHGECSLKTSCACDEGFCGDACQYVAGDAACNSGTFLSQTFFDGKYNLEWMIDLVLSEITFKLTITTAAGSGWIGFGVGKSMSDADIYQAYLDTSTGRAVVRDCSSTSQAQPVQDLVQDATLVAGSVSGNTLTIQFTRKLDTGDSADKPITDSDLDCIISMNTVVNNVGTQHTDRLPININFFSGSSTSSDTTTLRVWHGILMFLCWAFFTVIGMVMARFFKSIGRPWFITHIIANTLAIVIQWVAFILVIVATSNDNSSHFVRDTTNNGAYLYMIHAWVGLIVIIIGTVQPFIGIAADRLFDPTRKSVPIWPDRIHWWLGRNAILIGLINIYLGIFVADNTFGVDLWIPIVYGVWLFLVFVVYIVLQIRQIRNGGDDH